MWKTQRFLDFIIRNGFDYFTGGRINLTAYRENNNGLIVLPESKYIKKSLLFYLMYDKLVKEGLKKYQDIFENSGLIKIQEILSGPDFRHRISEKLVRTAKK